MNDCAVAALYRFVELEDPAGLREPLQQMCTRHEVLGTLLLASEGINGTIAGPEGGVRAVLEFLAGLGLEVQAKFSFCAQPPFHRLRVRLKKEIVTLGEPGIDPRQEVGTYVDPRAFDALLADPEVVVIDTRNEYETRIGTFKGAIKPEIDTFRAFPEWVKANLDPERDQKVAMFCTGGIRCEKASALLLRDGFSEVFHLEGGILRYLEQTEPSASEWEGECFVFDQRVAVDAHLRPGRHRLCYGCLEPVAPEDMAHPHFEEGVCCPRCWGRTTEEDRERRRERRHQMALADARGDRHLGRKEIPTAVAESAPNQDGVLYSFRRCPYAMRARMVLMAVGAFDPEVREVVLRAKPPEMLGASATVPVWILADGEVVPESLDIMERAWRARPEALPRLQSDRLAALVEANDTWFKQALDAYKYPKRSERPDPEGAFARASEQLLELDAWLGVYPFLDGEAPGFHDAAVFPFVRQFAAVDLARFEAGPWPALLRWRSAMLEHPFFTRVMKKLKPWRAGEAPLLLSSTIA